MKRIVSIVVVAAFAALTTAIASAQQFDPKVYQQMVDASSNETIPPGTKITVHNWTKYQNFLPYFVRLAFQGTSHFHVVDSPDYVVEVGPTEDYPIPKAMRQDTEKYAGQTKLLPYPATGGFIWSGYQAGTPFPNPAEPNKAAKIMYNLWAGFFQPFVLHEFSHNWLTDGFGNVQPEDTDDAFYRLMHLSDPPHPMNLPDAAGYMIANRFIEMIPEQAKYTTALELIPEDPARLTEEYVFLPSLRRSLRLSSASRCAPILGTDFLADDSDWKPTFFRPEYIGEKKLLVPFINNNIAFTEGSRAAFMGGDKSTGVAFPGWPKAGYTKWQVRKVYLVNLRATQALGRGYCYSDRIFSVDTQTWQTYTEENYDRAEKLYHIVWDYPGTTMYEGHRTVQPRAFGGAMGYDWENNHATASYGYDLTIDDQVPGEYRASGVYTPGGLDRVMK
jgi:hypothetical protein